MARNTFKVVNQAFVSTLRSSTWIRIEQATSRTSFDWVIAPRFPEPLLPQRKNAVKDGPFDALGLGLVKDVSVREGGVIGTLSALEDNDSQEDFVVRRLELGDVFRAEGPRYTPVQGGGEY